MKYKLSYEVKRIKSKVIMKFKGNEAEYESDAELADVEFDKYYLINSITAENDMIILNLVENTKINDISWCGEEQISFFREYVRNDLIEVVNCWCWRSRCCC